MRETHTRVPRHATRQQYTVSLIINNDAYYVSATPTADDYIYNVITKFTSL